MMLFPTFGCLHSDKNRNVCSRLSSQRRTLKPDRLLGATLPARARALKEEACNAIIPSGKNCDRMAWRHIGRSAFPNVTMERAAIAQARTKEQPALTGYN
jgi:hypothetical protein